MDDAAEVLRMEEAELLARALGGANPSVRVRHLGERLSRIPLWQRRVLGPAGLVRDHAVAAAHASRLAAIWELADRSQTDDRPVIASPRDALLLLGHLRDARREEVVTIMLDARHRPIDVDTVAVGTINASRLQPRDVFAPALRRGAVAVIIGHNHPSGDAMPSRADRVVTAALRAAGDMLGVAVLDHLIVTARSHHSFKDAECWESETAA
ncbi:MAG: JAB domain-containing protein [Candidatus Dormibacteraeota bacterium]|nr:JAB domain-containing protein [Candidatus Dormibacteraeota bacterium]